MRDRAALSEKPAMGLTDRISAVGPDMWTLITDIFSTAIHCVGASRQHAECGRRGLKSRPCSKSAWLNHVALGTRISSKRTAIHLSDNVKY